MLDRSKLHRRFRSPLIANRGEIAIRTAVGAQRHNIRNLVFAEGLLLVADGLIFGAVATFFLAQILRSFLFRAAPADPVRGLTVRSVSRAGPTAARSRAFAGV